MKLEANDGTTAEISAEQVQLSGLLRTMDDEGELLPLANVSGFNLSIIAAFFALSTTVPVPRVPAPLPSGTMTMADVVPPAYADLINALTKEQVSDLVVAADYLQVDGLVSLCCARLALFVREMTPEETREFFGLNRE